MPTDGVLLIPMKIVLIGNCQIGPLADIFNTTGSLGGTVSQIMVHGLSDAIDGDVILAEIRSADLVLSQTINDSFPYRYVQTSFLESQIDRGIVKIANMYYSGYHPDFITIKSQPALLGPLYDYHSKIVIRSYFDGASPAQCSAFLADPDYNAVLYRGASEDSLAELFRREQPLHVRSLDLILDNYRRHLSFYTRNHPSNRLFYQYAARIVKQVTGADVALEGSLSYQLDSIACPANPYVYAAEGMDFDNQVPYRGMDVETLIRDPNADAARSYSALELCEAFYRIYDWYGPEMLTKLAQVMDDDRQDGLDIEHALMRTEI